MVSSAHPHIQSSLNTSASPSIVPRILTPTPTTHTSTRDAQELHDPAPGTQGDGSSSIHQIGMVDDGDGRMWIRPYSDSDFDPSKVARTINIIIKSKFEHPTSIWKSTTIVQRSYYFGDFMKKYKWDPIYDSKIKRLWNKKSEGLLRAMMERVRRGTDKGSWMPKSVLDNLHKEWDTPEYKKKRELGKKNRSSDTTGCLHTGGSIPHLEHQKR